MRFCLVTTFYPPHHFGGDGVFVYRLANALARRGHEVHVVHHPGARTLLAGSPSPSPGSYPNHSNVSLHPLGRGETAKLELLLGHQLGRPALQRRELERLLGGPFDVIHFHNISLLGGPGVLACGRTIKLCTLHEYWFVCAMHVLWRLDREACSRRTCLRCTLAGKRPPQLWRSTGAVERSVRHVDAFLAPSAFARAMTLAQGFPAPIRVLPHFIADEETQVADDSAPAAPNRPFFLYVGRLERLKGVHSLVERFRGLHYADLKIVGAGSSEAELREVAAGSPHIQFLGWIPHSELRELYRAATAVVVPSLCHETFGLVPLEAFAAGTPAIVRRAGALPELVEQSGGGLVYESDSELCGALELLLADRGRRDALGKRGYQAYRRCYSEEVHLGRYFEIIRELQGEA
jgi:glycosyltransferase involved in cell wall biosynthesis